MGQLKLFEDNEDKDDISKIEINKEYAKRFEHNKKREELQRYEELKKKGVIEDSGFDEESEESSDSEEEDDDIIGSSKKDLEFFEALLLVKKQDPSLKEKDIKLFDSESDESEHEIENDGDKTGKKDKKKSMYLKDVMAKHLIEEGPEFKDENEEDEELGKKKKKKKIKSYSEEQEDMRKAFLDAVKEAEENVEEEDGFLKEKKKDYDNDGDFEDAGNDEFVKKLDEYFGGDDVELDENKLFLKEYFKNKMWIDKGKKDKQVEIDEEEVEDLLKEDEELEKQELYEHNYRHEEEVEDRILGHSRRIEGSVRKKDNARKAQRKSKEERMKIAEKERKEELKHLKNLKKKEMEERMKRVMEIAGIQDNEGLPLELKDLDDEFDPDKYDSMMKAVFNDRYYDAEDVDTDFGKDREEVLDEKPDFDKEDELLGLPKGWHVTESNDGFKVARERSLKHNLENSGDDDDDGVEEAGGGKREEEEEEEEEEEAEEEEEVVDERERKKQRKLSLVQKAKEEMLEEFYKLDYEDTIGDLKTRFKYVKVQPNRFGLKTEEILQLDDKELNQYVSIKKLAPYREQEWRVPKIKRYQQKLKIKEQKSDNKKSGKKRKHDTKKPNNYKEDRDEQNHDMAGLSNRAKTRRRQAKPKLSHSRLIAYGKIPSKAKK